MYVFRAARPTSYFVRAFPPASERSSDNTETGEIREHPRCRNGRITFIRRNWPSKRSAMTVSGYFPEGERTNGRTAGRPCVHACMRAWPREAHAPRDSSRVYYALTRHIASHEADRSAIGLVGASWRLCSSSRWGMSGAHGRASGNLSRGCAPRCRPYLSNSERASRNVKRRSLRRRSFA